MDRAPRAVTLDLFGTLLDFSIERDEPPLVERLLVQDGSSAPVDAVLSTWLKVSLAHRAREPFRTVEEALTVGAEGVREAFSLDLDPRRWTRALEDLWASRPPSPGARELLAALRAQGIPYAIVTNLDQRVLDRVLDHAGLATLVDVAVCSELARAYKPHPRLWQLALAPLGVRAADAVHVGDSPKEDLAGATAAGLRAVLVDPHAGDRRELLPILLGPR